jgi:hypothetical protein
MKTIVVGAGLNAHLYGPDHFLSSWGNFMNRFNMVPSGDNIPAMMTNGKCSKKIFQKKTNRIPNKLIRRRIQQLRK